MSCRRVDSFAHYDNAGIALKYSSAGGSINTNPAHIRTGPQSLRVQAGDAPSIVNFILPADTTQTYSTASQFSLFTVGIARQADALNGTVYTLKAQLGIDPSPPETILSLVQNSDGSLSLLDGSAVEIGRSAAGVITAGNFYYLTLAVDLVDSPTTAVLTVITSAFVATDVISVSGFSASQTFVDAIFFDGPAGPDFAYLNDFMMCDDSDGIPAPFAPNIYAAVPNGDGSDPGWDFSTFGSWQPVGFTHVPLVNSIPQDESQGIQFLADPQYAPQFPPDFIDVVAESYLYDLSGIPNDGRTLESLQVVFLTEYGSTQIAGVETIMDACFQDGAGGVSFPGMPGNLQPIPDFPWAFITGCFATDPLTGSPWDMTDWFLGNRQMGPGTFSFQ